MQYLKIHIIGNVRLIISISSMKKHAALIIASLDDYCAVVETSEGFHVFVKIHELLHL
jgi:hypothetical protein